MQCVMGKKDLKDTFIDLEEAVDKLLDNRKVSPGGSRLKSTASGKSASVIDKEAVELIRKAIKRLRSLY